MSRSRNYQRTRRHYWGEPERAKHADVDHYLAYEADGARRDELRLVQGELQLAAIDPYTLVTRVLPAASRKRANRTNLAPSVSVHGSHVTVTMMVGRHRVEFVGSSDACIRTTRRGRGSRKPCRYDGYDEDPPTSGG